MTAHYPLMADARPGNSPLHVYSPFDGALLAQVETVDEPGGRQALARAHGLYASRESWLKPSQRLEILTNAATRLAEEADRLADIALKEGGKPLVDTRIELARAVDGLRLCAQCIRTDHGEEIPMAINPASMGRLALTRHEPIGVVLAYSAFNHPVNLIVHQVGPAIAAGCPVVVKPASETPMSCYEVVRVLREAGLPPEWCQVISTSGHDVSEALVSDPRVGFFSFIGSAGVGWRLRSQLAPGARCALEHGGIAPVLIAEDADIDAAIPLLAKGGFYHAGQVCISVQRVYCPTAMAEQVATRLAEAGAAMEVGDPGLDTTEIGPLIRQREVARVDGAVKAAVAAGARLIGGGEPVGERCYAPTVLLNPPAEAEVTCHEIFGPVISVYACADMDEAIARANATDFSFQAAVFTRDIDTALHAYRQLNASAVMVNDQTAFRVDWMPFAGLRHSGHGVGGIPHTYAEMQIEKMLVINSPSL